MADHEQMEQSPQNSPYQELSEDYINNKIEKWTHTKINKGSIELPSKPNQHIKPLRSTYQFNDLASRKHGNEQHNTDMEILEKLGHDRAGTWELIN